MLKNKRGGLGRGIESLLGEVARDVIAQPEFEALKQIDAANIRAGIYQPRKVFHDAALQELAQSIAEHGILQPLVVRPINEGKYEIIAGERRFRASQIAGLTKIPCVVKNYTDQQALAVALIENLQRSDLNILEVANALQRLVQNFSLTHEKAAQLVGRSRSSITNTLRLLELSEPVKDALYKGEIEMGHGRAMLTLSESQQKILLAETLGRRYSVRQIEMRVKQLQRNEAITPAPVKTRDVNIDALENRLSDFLGYSVTIRHNNKGQGKLVLKYNNLDELDGILAKWQFK
ncbi:MAG: ParB/RepB/Spo0J family partition protein [Cardiobacteriaceae bacterium]|nr:ParB/RepB/Spo0J family partition protein [Cardiobacteriaceae bacterium]